MMSRSDESSRVAIETHPQSCITSNVVAVVVTFHPGPGFDERLAHIRSQVNRVIVVDNGSHEACQVRKIATSLGCDVICNCENMGIAAALNTGVKYARALNAEWIATFDQDSELALGAIRRMLDTLVKQLPPTQEGGPVAVLGMSHRDQGTGADYHRAGDIIRETSSHRWVRAAITSGSLIHSCVFDVVGYFDEQLFIDMVDLDFCLRCRRAGFSIVEDPAVILNHAIGQSQMKNILGLRFTITNHNSMRRYYITRNQLELVRRYIFFDPRWALGLAINLIGVSAATILFERDKLAKCAAMIRGVFDFVFRRFGRR